MSISMRDILLCKLFAQHWVLESGTRSWKADFSYLPEKEKKELMDAFLEISDYLKATSRMQVNESYIYLEAVVSEENYRKIFNTVFFYADDKCAPEYVDHNLQTEAMAVKRKADNPSNAPQVFGVHSPLASLSDGERTLSVD